MISTAQPGSSQEWVSCSILRKHATWLFSISLPLSVSLCHPLAVPLTLSLCRSICHVLANIFFVGAAVEGSICSRDRNEWALVQILQSAFFLSRCLSVVIYSICCSVDVPDHCIFLMGSSLCFSIKPFTQQAYPIQPGVTTTISSKAFTHAYNQFPFFS